LYRDRCDSENGFDELKNQCWGGFTTQDMLAARSSRARSHYLQLVELVRAPTWLSAALTSRPLLAAVGRATSHAGQTLLHLTPMHAETGLIKSMIANVQAAVRHVRRAAEQLPSLDRWRALLAYICSKIVSHNPLQPLPPTLPAPA
jgi:hypothetical protein